MRTPSNSCLLSALRPVSIDGGQLEKFIVWSMDEVYKLSQSGENDDLKMQIAALEYRTRSLIERWRKAGVI